MGFNCYKYKENFHISMEYKIQIFSFLFFLLIYCESLAQDVSIYEGQQNKNLSFIERYKFEPHIDSKEHETFHNVYLGFATGIKYQSIGGEKEIGISPSLLLNLMFKVCESGTSFWGFEFKYYRYGWNTKNHIENVFFLNPFYQWNEYLFSDTYLLFQTGLSVFSNNAVLFFSHSIDIGLNYKLNNIIFFIKNNFNINYLILANIVSLINIGVNISL